MMYIIFISACAYLPERTVATDNKNDISKVPDHYFSAIGAARKGETDKAIKLLTGITEKNPVFSPAYTNLGLQYLQTKKYKQAEKSLKKALDINYNDAIAYNHLGIIMRIKGDFSNAKDMYQHAIRSNANYANAHLNLGILLDLYMHELVDALQHYKNYQSLTNNSDKVVGKWIIDIERQIKLAKGHLY